MQYLPFSVPVGASFPLRMKANYCRYYKNTAGAANPTVRIRTDKGDDVLLSLNEAAHFSRTWENATLENYDGVATISGVLLIGEGQVDVSTFSGSVAVTSLPGLVADNADGQAPVGAGGILPVLARLQGFDGTNFNRIFGGLPADAQGNVYSLYTAAMLRGWNGASSDMVRADNEGAGAGALRTALFADAIAVIGAAFHHGATVGAGAGLFSHVQILNPAASGKAAYIDRLTVSASGASGIRLCYYDVALATDAGAGLNKSRNGAAGVSHVRYAANAAILGTTIGEFFASGSGPMELKQDVPIILPQGTGLLVVPTNVNIAMSARFQWREK